jgi:uncharacterized protein (TIGR00661 family)
MRRRRLLWGVCGIGLGHCFRQLPLLEHYAKNSELVVLAYGSALSFLRKHFTDHPHVQVAEVAVPYWPGTLAGLDFAAAATHAGNAKLDMSMNARAMQLAADRLGAPHAVISDYEPVSAQYAYACSAPLITLDQQSKYLTARLPARLAGTGYADEIMRLRMFFPRAEARLACSFFKQKQKVQSPEKVSLIPPILSDQVRGLRRKPTDEPMILVYLSEQMRDAQKRADLLGVLAAARGCRFEVYLPEGAELSGSASHVRLHRQGDGAFHAALASCHGLVTTAGHSLLSEAMHLGIPVLALPLGLYEQQMNAAVIQAGGFGLMRARLTGPYLREFIRELAGFARHIRRDRRYLLRGDGTDRAISTINRIIA